MEKSGPNHEADMVGTTLCMMIIKCAVVYALIKSHDYASKENYKFTLNKMKDKYNG